VLDARAAADAVFDEAELLKNRHPERSEAKSRDLLLSAAPARRGPSTPRFALRSG
jgi:hypothetical protein